MKRMRRALGMAAVTAVIAPLVGVPQAQAAAPETQLAGYAPAVATAAINGLVEREGLTRDDAARRLASQPTRIELGERLVTQLGSRAAGMWLDQASDTVVVNVLDDATATTVRAAGADARVVERSLTRLEVIRDTLAGTQVPDTAVGIDLRANQVLVRVGETAAGTPGLSGMLATADTFGDAVRVEYADGTFNLRIAGGYAIAVSMPDQLPYCTLGFSTTPTAGTTRTTGLTAGHCTLLAEDWIDISVPQPYGESVDANFPQNDFGLIRAEEGVTQPGVVFRYDTETDQDIATASDPVEDMAICMSGATSRTACGTVLDLNQRVCYTSPVAGCVDGLASSDVLTANGDSGGPWFTGHVAVGLTSGGAGSTSYFQPVVEALFHYGVWVL